MRSDSLTDVPSFGRADRGARIVLVQDHAGRQRQGVVVELLAREVDPAEHLVAAPEPLEGVAVVGLGIERGQVLHLVVGAAGQRRRVVDRRLRRRDRVAVRVGDHPRVRVRRARAEADRRGAQVAVVAAVADHRVPLAGVAEAVGVLERPVRRVAGVVVAPRAVVVLRVDRHQPGRIVHRDRPRVVAPQPRDPVVHAVAVLEVVVGEQELVGAAELEAEGRRDAVLVDRVAPVVGRRRHDVEAQRRRLRGLQVEVAGGAEIAFRCRR